jgi:hypothetical protein
MCALQAQIDRFAAYNNTSPRHSVSDRGTRIRPRTLGIKVAVARRFKLAVTVTVAVAGQFVDVAVGGRFHATVWGRFDAAVWGRFHVTGSPPQSQQHRTLNKR